MATIGHLAAGLAVGRLHAGEGRTVVSLAAFAGLALLPGADAIGILLGHPLRGALGHRGATHSLAFALAAALAASLTPLGRGLRGSTFLLALAAVVSHPLLDMLCRGGVRLLWPFDGAWRWFAWTPLTAAPIELRLVSPGGLALLFHEAVLFAPVALWALWPRHAPGAVRPVRAARAAPLPATDEARGLEAPP